MTAAIFGLVGVVVGAIVSGVVTALLQRRAEHYDRRSAARLVRSELVGFRSLGRAGASHRPEDLPQLRNLRPILWQSNRAVLARALSNEHWKIVARAYAHVDALASVLVFEPDGTLVAWRSREAQSLLAAMVEPVERAALSLDEEAGTSSDAEEELGELPEFPEEGPVPA